MSYSKEYVRINWENYTSTNTPLNASNLNKMDYSIDAIEDELVILDTTKGDQSVLLDCCNGITYDSTTGQFHFTFVDGTSLDVDLNIEKIPVSFSMSAQGVITMKTSDGSTYTADVGSLIKTYTFDDTEEINFTTTTDISGNKRVRASLIDGSIAEEKLETNFLADCRTAQQGAQASAQASSSSASTSSAQALVSEGYANGTQGGVPVTSESPYYHNNSKYWKEQAQEIASGTLEGLSDVNIINPQNDDVFKYDSVSQKWVNRAGGGGGTSDYSDLTNKPKINNVELSGNKSLSDLGIQASETGKGLSTNDYTTTDKNKLSGIEAGAEVNVQADWEQTDSSADDYIKNKPNIPSTTVLTKTLTAGQTTLTFTDASITSDCLVDVYVNHADAFPTDVDDSVSGSITLTFDSQIADLSVKLVIS